METMFQWLGLAVAWVIVVLLAIGLFGWIIEGIKSLHERMVSDAKLVARQDLGREISAQAHWFSESKEAQTVLVILGQRLAQNPDYRYDAENVREAWRRKLTEK